MEPVSIFSYYFELQKQMALLTESSKKGRQTPAIGEEEFGRSSGTIPAESMPEGQPTEGNKALTELDIHRLLVETAEEMNFDLPEFLKIERIKAGIVEISLALFVAVAAIGLVIIY